MKWNQVDYDALVARTMERITKQLDSVAPPRQVWAVSYVSPSIGYTASHYYSWRSAMQYALAVARWSITRPRVRRVR